MKRKFEYNVCCIGVDHMFMPEWVPSISTARCWLKSLRKQHGLMFYIVKRVTEL